MKNATWVTTLLWIITVGSCSAGAGLEASSEYITWGHTLTTFGTFMAIYLLFIRD